ncbi:MAG: isoamylase early set domain-containing protein [Anaerolineae bacterium]|jgi:1,4-alpha-glucan branching enzyme|nr:isoamylase early set domain-containing protein [Anaerolineae bacterium]
MYKKRILKSGKVKVDFVLPEAIAAGAETAFLVGDFNDWDESATPMQKLKNGNFKVSITLEPNREYHFRYLVNDKWHNDWNADRYVPNPFSGDNSVITT